MNVTVDEVHGLSELDAFLRTLPDELQRKMLYSALMTGAKPIMDQAKRNVQSRFGGSVDYTGRLERGITRGRVRKTGLAARVNVSLKGGRNNPDNPFYGRFLEFGTSKMEPKPWLRPAGEMRRTEAGREFNRALQTQIQKWCKANGVTFRPGSI